MTDDTLRAATGTTTDVTGVADAGRASRPDGASAGPAPTGSLVPVKTFDDLFAELTEKARTRPEGSGTVAELDAGELESLAAFATGRLRPDVSVLLDRAPSPAEADAPAGDDTTPIPVLPGEEHLRVRRLLTRMAAAGAW